MSAAARSNGLRETSLSQRGVEDGGREKPRFTVKVVVRFIFVLTSLNTFPTIALAQHNCPPGSLKLGLAQHAVLRLVDAAYKKYTSEIGNGVLNYRHASCSRFQFLQSSVSNIVGATEFPSCGHGDGSVTPWQGLI